MSSPLWLHEAAGEQWKFALDNTDYRSHEQQQEAIECYLSWRNRIRDISLEDWKSYRRHHENAA